MKLHIILLLLLLILAKDALFVLFHLSILIANIIINNTHRQKVLGDVKMLLDRLS